MHIGVSPNIVDASFEALVDSDTVAYRLKGGSKYARTLRGNLGEEPGNTKQSGTPWKCAQQRYPRAFGPASNTR